jgi:hypothetical protein
MTHLPKLRPLSLALAIALPAIAAAQDLSKPLVTPPSPDPRVGLKAGHQDAGEASWNIKLIGHVAPDSAFENITNSDLAFSGNNVIQGSYNGFQIWNVDDPSHPAIRIEKICPASQSDVSVYKNYLFVSAEAPTARMDCGRTADTNVVSNIRIRGLRIFDITDISNPKYLANVQTCRGSHTHTVVHDPKDSSVVYVYISGTSGIRPTEELSRCVGNPWDPNTSNFRIEVIKIPLAHPEQAAVVSSPPIFADPTNGVAQALLYPRGHGASPADTAANRARAQFDTARAKLSPLTPMSSTADSAKCVADVEGLAQTYGVPLRPAGGVAQQGGGRGRGGVPATPMQQELARGGGCTGSVGGGRGGRGGGRGGANRAPVTREDSMTVDFNEAVAGLTPLAPTAKKADTTKYQSQVNLLAKKYGVTSPFAPRTLTQCHDITVYPAVGLAGGACAGMGLLLDIHNTANPKRIAQYADSNFSFWHSATFSNDGKMLLFSDEWGGGGAAYCRAGDPMNWGADAIFKIVNGKLIFQNYYKMPAPQTAQENCVAHNGSLIPIPGRTIMVQAWYQGGLSVFEWTDPKHPHEIAFFDRGPNDATRLQTGGFWSTYWYNGHIYGSEILRGMDVFDLQPSAAISQNEIDAANTIHFDFLNVQDQPKFVWPASFALAKAYTDQLERWKGLSATHVDAVRKGLSDAEGKDGTARKAALTKLATTVAGYKVASSDPSRVQLLDDAIKGLAAMK